MTSSTVGKDGRADARHKDTSDVAEGKRTECSHTPGPWEVAYLDKNGQRVVKSQHIEICTCWHHCVGSIEKEMEANARLIAAAPELFEALAAIGAPDEIDLTVMGDSAIRGWAYAAARIAREAVSSSKGDAA